MNDYHSDTESIYKKRLITDQVKSAISKFPVVVITGARQVGKTTFLQNEFKAFKYVSLDDFSALQQAKTDPASLWAGTDHIIIDEAQKAPELFPVIKSTVDTTNRKIRFILSGSSNILLMKRISDSLAGRAIYFDMFPMTFSEMDDQFTICERFFDIWRSDFKVKENTLSLIDPVPLMLRGFMPPLMFLKERQDILLWWEGYVRTYLERDVRELARIDSLIDFKKVLDFLALRTGNILNQTEVSRDSGISQPTIFRYLKLLEISNIINRVPAYYRNRTKRIIKSPKIFFIDPGLCIYLSGYYDMDSLMKARELGNFFETMMYMHIKIATELMIPKANIYYWRTTTGKEVDFVVEHGKNLLAIEIKLLRNPSFNDIKNLLTFLQEYPSMVRGLLLHSGNSIKWLHSKILAVPWWWLWITP